MLRQLEASQTFFFSSLGRRAAGYFEFHSPASHLYVNETRSQIQLEMGHEWLAFTLALLSAAASSLWK
jgi:hypothetical protein